MFSGLSAGNQNCGTHQAHSVMISFDFKQKQWYTFQGIYKLTLKYIQMWWFRHALVINKRIPLLPIFEKNSEKKF